MRTTVRIDDDLLRDLKQRAQQNKTSLTKMINLILRRGVVNLGQGPPRKGPYREKTYSMGIPSVDLTKALALAAELEDEEVIKKMTLGK